MGKGQAENSIQEQQGGNGGESNIDQPYRLAATLQASGTAVVTLEGKFDYSTTQVLIDAVVAVLADPNIDLLAMDMRRVIYIDSAALGVMVGASSIFRRRFALVVQASSQVERSLRITNLDRNLIVLSRPEGTNLVDPAEIAEAVQKSLGSR